MASFKKVTPVEGDFLPEPNSKHEIMKSLQDLISSGDLNYYDCQAIAQTAKTAWVSNRNKNKPPSIYADYDIGARSLEKIINTELTANQALLESATELGRDEQYLKTVKHKNYLHSSRIVDNFKSSHLIQAIEDHDILDITELSTASRLYLFIKTAYLYKQYLKDQQYIHDRIDDLEKKDREKDQALDQLRAEMYVMHNDIKTLQEATAIKELPNKEKILLLQRKGFKVKTICDTLGISKTTYYRTLKDNTTL